MRNQLRYLFIAAVVLILSALLLTGFSAPRQGIMPEKIDWTSSNHDALSAGRFLLASLLLEGEDDPPLPEDADMGVTKTASADQVTAGANVTYTITVRNGGPLVAADATLNDPLPTGMTFVSLSKPDDWTCTTPAVGSEGTVTCSKPTFAVNAEVVFTLVVNVPANTEPGTFFNNTATVSTTTLDLNEENNSYPAGTGVAVKSVDVGVTKTANADQVAPGSNLTYTITVNNTGPEAAADVTLDDTLPGDMTFVSLSEPGGWMCSTPNVDDGGTIHCSKPSLAVTNGEVFTLVGRVPSGTQQGTTYTNTATVTTTTTDLNAENNSSTVSNDAASADISVSKVDTSDPVTVGDNLTYTITVNNSGPSSFAPVTLSDTLPAGTTFVSLSPAPGDWGCTTPAVGAGGSISCSNSTFPAGGNGVFTLVVKVGTSVSGGAVLSNTATVVSSFPDPNTGNESATATTAVLSPATLSGTKTVTGQFTPGGNVTYNVVLTNTGPHAQGNNPGNEFTDVLPSGLTLVSATASSGSAVATVATNTVTWNGGLSNGSSVAITIQATVKSGTAGTTISNQGTISYDADGNGTNEAAAVTDDPGVAGSNNPTSFAVSNAPTISAVGVTRMAGNSASNSTIANVNDVEDAENTLSVTVNNGASAIVNGVTVSNILVSAAGVVTADVVAACNASTASFTLKVTDSDALSNTAALSVTVNENSAPVLTYSSPQTVAFGGSLTVNPATGPSDNGSVSSIVVQSQGTYTGTISVNNSTGVVSISNAAPPSGTHTITIRATDNCGRTTDASFNLTVGSAPNLSINNVSVTEGNTGTTDAVFTVTLSSSSNLTTRVDYQTADSTALSGSDYQPTTGTLTFNPGDTIKTITVPVIGDTTGEADETFLINLTNPQNATLAGAQGVGTIKDDDGAVIQLSSQSYSVGEGAGRADITVTRTGNTSVASSVDYTTSDLSGLTNCDVNNGNASARCDYTGVRGTLSFAAGITSLTFTIPVIDDVYVEGPETLSITLSNAGGAASVGAPSTATLTITDNDNATGSPNPIDGNEFFIRELYLDFLNREPEPPGLAAWLQTLNNCSPGDIRCDRVEVASAFFRSGETFDRTYFIYRFYEVALGRQPQFDEYQNDLRRLTGFLTDVELEARKREFIASFMARQEFRDRYEAITDPLTYVTALERTAGVTPEIEHQLIVDMGNGLKTRADALRAIVESPEVSQKFYNKAFVVTAYFAFLRRNPDAAYLHWIEVLNTTGDYREMIRGFLQASEYRLRFGPM